MEPLPTDPALGRVPLRETGLPGPSAGAPRNIDPPPRTFTSGAPLPGAPALPAAPLPGAPLPGAPLPTGPASMAPSTGGPATFTIPTIPDAGLPRPAGSGL